MRARMMATCALAMAVVGTALVAPAAAKQVDTDTPCGIAPDGYNVIVSDAATITGTDGDDYICGGGRPNHILGLGGDDHIYGRGGDDLIEGGDGHDVIHAGEQDDVVHGGRGNDQIDGARHHDILFGNDGNDIISGGPGRDIIRGELGRDQLDGGRGRDKIFGGAGSDTIRGGDEPDRLQGNKGDDTIAGDHGRDRILGGTGTDKCSGDRETECDDVIVDIGIKTIDRESVTAAQRRYDRIRSRAFFTPDSTVSIYLWSDPQLTALLGRTTVPTNQFGNFFFYNNAKFPIGSYIEVGDDATGQHVGVEITLDVSHYGEYPPDHKGVQSLSAWTNITAGPNTTFWEDGVSLFPYSDYVQRHQRTTDANGEYNGTLFMNRGSRSRTTVTVVQRRDGIETFELYGAPADLWISQYAVGADAGPWTPHGLVEVTRDGSIVGSPVRSDYRGRFGFSFDSELTPGTTVTVRDLATNHVETVTYSADFELTAFTADLAVAVGSLWPGYEETEASGYVLDGNGRVRYGRWSLGNLPADWRFNLGPPRPIYVLAIQAINDDNHEVYFFF